MDSLPFLTVETNELRLIYGMREMEKQWVDDFIDPLSFSGRERAITVLQDTGWIHNLQSRIPLKKSRSAHDRLISAQIQKLLLP